MSLLVSVIIYIVSYLLSFVFIKLSNDTKKTRRKVIFALVGVLIPVFVATFRTSGVDFYTYKIIYKEIENGALYPIEYGWYFINYISPNFLTLLFISSFIFYFNSFIAIKLFLKKKYSLIWLFYILLFSGVFYNAMRQMLAVSIIFIGFYFLYKKRYIAFVVMTLIAMLFHKSSIAMVLLIPYVVIMKTIKNKLAFSLVISAVLLLLIPLMLYVIKLMGIYSSYTTITGINFSLSFLLYALPPLYYYYNNNFVRKNPQARFCLDLYLLIIPFQFLGMIVPYGERLMLYIQPAIVLLVAYIIRSFKIRKKNISSNYVLWFGFQYFVMFVIMNSNSIFPYRSVI